MSHQSHKSGMGAAKHRTSGHATKSPRLRHQMKREAEANVRSAPAKCSYASITDLMKTSRR